MANNFIGGHSQSSYYHFGSNNPNDPSQYLFNYHISVQKQVNNPVSIKNIFNVVKPYNLQNGQLSLSLHLGSIMSFALIFTYNTSISLPSPVKIATYAVRTPYQNNNKNYELLGHSMYLKDNNFFVYDPEILDDTQLLDSSNYLIYFLESYVSHHSTIHPMRIGMRILSQYKSMDFLSTLLNKTQLNLIICAVFSSPVYVKLSQLDNSTKRAVCPLWVPIVSTIPFVHDNKDDIVRSIMLSHSALFDFTLPFEAPIMDVKNDSIDFGMPVYQPIKINMTGPNTIYHKSAYLKIRYEL